MGCTNVLQLHLTAPLCWHRCDQPQQRVPVVGFACTAACAPGCFSTAATLPSVMESPMAGTTTSPAAAVLVWIHLAANGSSCCRPVGCNCCRVEKGCAAVHLRAGHSCRGWVKPPRQASTAHSSPHLDKLAWLRSQEPAGTRTNVSPGKQQSSWQTQPCGPRQLTKRNHKLPKRGMCAGAGLQAAHEAARSVFEC